MPFHTYPLDDEVNPECRESGGERTSDNRLNRQVAGIKEHFQQGGLHQAEPAVQGPGKQGRGQRQQHSSNLFYTPPAFGGGLQQAIQGFQAAAPGFEAKGTENNWPYLQCLAMLGQAQQADGQREAARATYQKALATAPGFRWVRDELLPALEQ